MRERYSVITVEGFPGHRVGAHNRAAGLSAHVIDRPDAHRVVATFCSEDRIGGIDARGRQNWAVSRGVDGARLAAEALAAEWNADDARR